jgi:hypothetical protein
LIEQLAALPKGGIVISSMKITHPYDYVGVEVEPSIYNKQIRPTSLCRSRF